MSIILRERFLFFLILLPLVLVIIWFQNGLITGKGEEGLIFYNLSKNLELSQSTWVDVNTGMPNLYWLPRLPILYIASILNVKLGLAQYLIQAGLFYLLIVIGIVSIYFLTNFFLKHHSAKYLISFISALFYLLNPFSLSQVWGRGLYPQYFSFALFPLSLLLLVYGLNKRKYIYLFPLLFSSAIYSWAFGIVTAVVCYWIILGGYYICWLATNRLNKREFFSGFYFMILFFFGWLLINAWWFLPFIIKGNAVFAGYLNQPSENLGTLLGVSKSFPPDVIIRLLQKGYFFDATAYSQIYSTIIFQLISLIPLVFVLIGVLKAIKNSDYTKFRFFAGLLLLGLVVSLGANPPFGKIFVWFFKNLPFLQAFRNPFEKFGLVYALGYAPLFAIGLVGSFEKIKFKFIGLFIVIFLICGIYAWPMWTGRVLAGIDNKIGVKVPQYYEELNTWLQKNDSHNYRIFMTPLLVGEAGVFHWEDTKYNGVDPMHFILDRAAISNGAQIPFYFDFALNIRKYMEREDIAAVLSLLRIKFLINRGDAVAVSDAEKKQYKFLTSTVTSPSGAEESLTSICRNSSADSRKTGLAWVVCHIEKEGSDLSKAKYMHMRIKTDLPANLEISLRDDKGTRIYWHGRIDSDYRTEASEWHNIVLSLSTPTENDASINLSKAEILEVWAYLKDAPEKSVGQINISEIKLDPGIEKKMNGFKKITEFGQLSVLEQNNFNPPPEFGILTAVDIVKDFPQLIEESGKKRDFIDKQGFVLQSQNNKKDLQKLTDADSWEIVSEYKVSDTRYWIKINQKKGLIILSKTFNTQWKIIPGISKNQLSGDFLQDLNLLRRVFSGEENHFVVNGYANLWVTEGNQDQYAVIFLPQIYADLGLRISITFAGIAVLIWGMLYLNKFKSKTIIKSFR